MSATKPSSEPVSSSADAGTCLVERNLDWLCRVVDCRVRDRSQRDDVLQNVRLAAIRHSIHELEEQHAKRWLCRVAISECACLIRQSAKTESLHDSDLQPRHDRGRTQDPLYWLINDEERTAVARVMRTLDVETATLLKLKYDDNRTYKQIAEHLGISKDAAEYRIVRARHRLRELLNAAGYETEDRL